MHHRRYFVENVRGELSRLAHPFEARRTMQLDRAVNWNAVCGDFYRRSETLDTRQGNRLLIIDINIDDIGV